jgi:hypothetical protein
VFNFNRTDIRANAKKLLKEMDDIHYQKYFGDEETKKKTRAINIQRQKKYEVELKEYESMMMRKANDEDFDLQASAPEKVVLLEEERDPETSLYSKKIITITFVIYRR